MSRGVALARGRRAAEAGMVDTCTITKPGDGEPVFDEETGQYVDPPPVTVYTGRCEVQVPGQIASPSETDAGGREWTVQDVVLKLPVTGSEAVRVGNTATVDASTHDAALAGRVFRVEGLHHKTHATSRRLRCVEVTG